MYPALFTLVTAALIVALYAELKGMLDAEPESGGAWGALRR